MKLIDKWLNRMEETEAPTVLFGIFKIAAIVTLAAGYFDASARINALDTRVKDLAVRLEVTAAERRDILVVGQLDLDAVLAAHDKRRDAKRARAAVLDDEDGATERRGVVHDETNARAKAFTDAVEDFVADPKGGDGGKGEGKDFVGVHGRDYSKGAAGAQCGEAAP